MGPFSSFFFYIMPYIVISSAIKSFYFITAKQEKTDKWGENNQDEKRENYFTLDCLYSGYVMQKMARPQQLYIQASVFYAVSVFKLIAYGARV